MVLSFRRCETIGEGEHLTADRLETDLRGHEPGGHTLDDAPLEDRRGVETASIGHPPRGRLWIGGEWFVGVLAQDHPEVVLGFGEQTIGVDQLEAVAGLQRVPLLHVTVHEDRPLVVVGVEPALRTREGVLDGALRARFVEFGPRLGDVIHQPHGLLGAGRQATVVRGPPDLPRPRRTGSVGAARTAGRDGTATARAAPSAVRLDRDRRGRAPGSRSPAAIRSTVASWSATPVDRGTSTFRIDGVPSAMTASVTSASVPSSNCAPISISQSRASDATSSGSSRSIAPAPAASARFRTTSGSSIMSGDDLDTVRGRAAAASRSS